jgi:GTPase SAR1 family protein
MFQKKVCMLGASGVGKTSLVSRFVENMFSETWQTTVGVLISKKTVKVGDQDLTMVIWDLAGFDKSVRLSYLSGMSGFLLVADGTSPSSLERACQVYKEICSFEQPPPAKPNPNVPYIQFPYRQIPFYLLLNKSDLVNQWKIDDSDLQNLKNKGWPIIKSSAKENTGVEESFLGLGRKITS